MVARLNEHHARLASAQLATTSKIKDHAHKAQGLAGLGDTARLTRHEEAAQRASMAGVAPPRREGQMG